MYESRDREATWEGLLIPSDVKGRDCHQWAKTVPAKSKPNSRGDFSNSAPAGETKAVGLDLGTNGFAAEESPCSGMLGDNPSNVGD